jgi:hypothetical protein
MGGRAFVFPVAFHRTEGDGVKLDQIIVLVLVIIVGATIANLVALKIAGDEVSKQLNAGIAANPVLSLFK